MGAPRVHGRGCGGCGDLGRLSVNLALAVRLLRVGEVLICHAVSYGDGEQADFAEYGFDVDVGHYESSL
jgi:hypothetical protein